MIDDIRNINRRYVFVYGTLKRGYHNNALLEGGNAEFIREDLLRGFVMRKLGAAIPAIFRVKDDRTFVHGEVWKVSDVCTERLDRLEGVDHGLYSKDNAVSVGGFNVTVYTMEIPASMETYDRVKNGRWNGPESLIIRQSVRLWPHENVKPHLTPAAREFPVVVHSELPQVPMTPVPRKRNALDFYGKVGTA